MGRRLSSHLTIVANRDCCSECLELLICMYKWSVRTICNKYNFSGFHFITMSSKSFAPFQKKKFLVFSNILIPSFFLHKNIFEVELKENYKGRLEFRPWSSLLLLHPLITLHSAAALSFKCLMLSAVTGKPKTTMSAQVLV